MLAVNVAVIIGVFLYKITREPYVPYIHLLVDYHFGFTKRALIGAVVSLFLAKIPVWLVFALADVAVAVNSSVENIGARRLQTVMERVLDEISFVAPDRNGETIRIDAAYVQKHVGDLAKNADLSRFIL